MGENVNCKCLKVKHSRKYLEVRSIRQVSNLFRRYITRNFVTYAGSVIFLWW